MFAFKLFTVVTVIAQASANFTISSAGAEAIRAAAADGVNNLLVTGGGASLRFGSGFGIIGSGASAQSGSRTDASSALLADDLSDAVISYVNCVGPSISNLIIIQSAYQSGQPWNESATIAAAQFAASSILCAISPLTIIAEIVEVRQRKVSSFTQVTSPFRVTARRDEGGQDNKYGWAVDYSEDCEVGIVIHSAGTSNFISGQATAPTVTLRDINGKVFWTDTIQNLTSLGIRSTSIVTCSYDNHKLESVSFTVSPIIGAPGGTPTTIDVTTIDVVTVSFKKNKNTVEINTVAAVADNGPSIRASLMLDECTYVYAVQNDNLVTLPTQGYVYIQDICNLNNRRGRRGGMGMGMGKQDNVVELSYDCPVLNNQSTQCITWDFKVTDTQLIISTSYLEQNGRPNLTPNFAIRPILYTTDPKVLKAHKSKKISLNNFNFPGNMVTHSAFTINTIESNNKERIIACTVSGFIYYGAFGGSTPDDLELFDGQQCFICNSTENVCEEISMEYMTGGVAYIWAVESCGPYTFVASLDSSGLISSGIRGIIGTILRAAFPILDALLDFAFANSVQPIAKQFETILEDIVAIAVATVLGDPTFTRADQGFDIWYIPTADLFNVTSSSEFLPITIDGFRRVRESPFGFQNEYSYDPAFSTGQDGIRNMVCFPGEVVNGWRSPVLVAASASYSLEPSASFEIDLGTFRSSKGSSTGSSISVVESSKSSTFSTATSVTGAIVAVAAATLLGYRSGRRNAMQQQEMDEQTPLLE